MKRRFFLTFAAAWVAAFAVALQAFAQNAAAPIDSIQISFDRESQVYSVGETATITVAALAKDGAKVDSGTISVSLTNDGRDKIGETATFDLAQANPIEVQGKLDAPGFLQISVSAKSTEEKAETKTALGGVAFDPKKIEPGLPKPDDFDEFWAAGKAEVRAIPIDVVQTRIESLCDETRDVYAVSFATVDDQRVYGYLGIPKIGEKPFPTLVNVPGAGPGTGPDLGSVAQGFVVLNMNVFPYEVPLDGETRKTLYDEYNAKLPYRYCCVDAGNREKYFFRAPYLGIDRAVDWLAEQDYVDASRVGYYGTSQGGASALILGGLNANFCAILASVPALCDHAGGLKGRSPGWPRLVDTVKDDSNVLEASRYLDAVNFAREIAVPIDVTVGFIDVTCSPSSVCSAFNVIPSAQKTLLYETRRGHSNGEQYKKAFERLKIRVKNGGSDPK